MDFAILYQRQIVKDLNIHLSEKHIKKFVTSAKRLRGNMFCPRVNAHLKKANRELILQLDSLINENDIDAGRLRDMGLLKTIKGEMDVSQSAISFELQMLRNYCIKSKVVDNMLHAINMIDSSTILKTA